MAESDITNEQSGGTEGDNQEPKSFSQEDVDKLIAAAKEEGTKEGQAAAHTHFQSIADKKISEVNRLAEEKLSAYEKELGEFRSERLKNMSAEERQAVMLEEIYNRTTKGGESNTSPAGDSQQTFNNNDGTDGDPRTASRNQISPVLKEMGFDVDKVDWGDDVQGPESMKRFIGSLLKQKEGEASSESKEPTEEEKDAERFSSSKSMGSGGRDILNMNPLDLISEGLKERKPARLIE